MHAFAILHTSMTGISDNRCAALKHSLLPVLIVCFTWIWLLLGDQPPARTIEEVLAPRPPLTLAKAIFGAAMTLLCVLWLAVGWHRFLLLGEGTVWALPRWRPGRVLAYGGYLLLIGSAATAVLVPVFTALALVQRVLGIEDDPKLHPLPPALMLAGLVMFSLVLGRLGLMLPAVAAGRPLGPRAALAATGSTKSTFAMLSLLLILLAYLQHFALFLIDAILPGLAGLLLFPIAIYNLLLGLSVLTTLYGHYIEGRPLVRA